MHNPTTNKLTEFQIKTGLFALLLGLGTLRGVVHDITFAPQIRAPHPRSAARFVQG